MHDLLLLSIPVRDVAPLVAMKSESDYNNDMLRRKSGNSSRIPPLANRKYTRLEEASQKQTQSLRAGGSRFVCAHEVNS